MRDFSEVVFTHGLLLGAEGPVVRRHHIQRVAAAAQRDVMSYIQAKTEAFTV